MTKNRKALIEFVWRELYSRTCPCGRCDCVSADPVVIAQRLLIHWSCQYRVLAKHSSGMADMYEKELLPKIERGARAHERKWGAGSAKDLWARADEHRGLAKANARKTRRYARAAVLYERLGRGLPPFQVAGDEVPR